MLDRVRGRARGWARAKGWVKIVGGEWGNVFRPAIGDAVYDRVCEGFGVSSG